MGENEGAWTMISRKGAGGVFWITRINNGSVLSRNTSDVWLR
jgi:hypothetical protein